MNRLGKRIDLFRPCLGKEELSAIESVFASGWIGNGKVSESVEKTFATLTGSYFAVATNSCTSALQVALKLRNVSAGDEVIVPTMTFTATAEAALSIGATPVLVDVAPETLLADYDSVKAAITPRTKAIILVLYAGRVLDWGDSVNGIPIIYDCAHAAGSRFRASGANRIACWSFNAVKNLGCGDGGMLTCNHPSEQSRAKSLAWHGITASTWSRSKDSKYTSGYDVEELGFRGQMSDITAAILSAQIGRLGEFQQTRRHAWLQYHRQLRGIDQIELLTTDVEYDTSSHHLVVARCRNRDALQRHLASRDITTGIHYKPLHQLTLFSATQQSFPVADAAYQEILSLPCHPALTADEVSVVCESIREFYERQ